MTVAFCLLVAGCASGEGRLVPGLECPYTTEGTVSAADQSDLGFSAEEVIIAAAALTSGLAESADIVGSAWPVTLYSTFTQVGDAEVVSFGEGSDPACPTGRGLLIPVSYAVTGLIDQWAVENADDSIALVATAPSRDAVSFVPTTEEGTDAWTAVVDAGLADLARSTLPGFETASCTTSFSLSPRPPRDISVGSWMRELTEGRLSISCAGGGSPGDVAKTFLTWEPVLQSP